MRRRRLLLWTVSPGASLVAAILVASNPIANAGSAPAPLPVVLSDDAATAAAAVVDPIADQATATAGSSFVSVRVDLATRTVALSMYQPPASLTAALASRFGAAIEVHAAANPASAIDAAKKSVEANLSQWLEQGVVVRHLTTTFDGHLEIGVASDVASAQTLLDASFGKGLVSVVSDTTVPVLDTYRYADVSPWNGGDLVYGDGENCTSGPNLKSGPQETASDASPGDEYMMVAAHCFDNGYQIKNGWLHCNVQKDPNCMNPLPDGLGSNTLIATCCFRHNNPNGTGYWDAALLKVNSSVVDFNCDWSCQGRAIQEDSVTNHMGDPICISDGFDGQRCGLTIGTTQTDE